MGYQALYRVYRSQRFADVVGQQGVTQTLQHAVAQQQVAHAYLFSGPRGTGKTSVAKIFAKAVNCLEPKDGEPCNHCTNCLAINEGRLPDVIELDAASNNGVDEIRSLCEKSKYAPTQGKYKVYIIDEVHMLSKGAFNALLKTLEEPSPNVIFILATTEVHKIPATIISRTQRFEFHRIEPQAIVQHLEKILQKEGVDYEPEAVEKIALLAEGGMRDALSLLDQSLASKEGKLTLEQVNLVTGHLPESMLLTYLNTCLLGNTKAALEQLHTALHEGQDGERFIDELLSAVRNLCLYRQDPNSWQGEAYQEAQLKQVAPYCEEKFLYFVLKEAVQAKENIRQGTQAELYLDILTLRLCQHEQLQKEKITATAPIAKPTSMPAEVQQLQQAFAQLQAEVQQLRQEVAYLKQHTHFENKATFEVPSFQVEVTSLYPIMELAQRSYLEEIKACWPQLIQIDPASFGALSQSEVVVASADAFIVAVSHADFARLLSENLALEAQLLQVASSTLQREQKTIKWIVQDQWPKIRTDYLKQRRREAVAQKQTQEKSLAAQTALQAFGPEQVMIQD